MHTPSPVRVATGPAWGTAPGKIAMPSTSALTRTLETVTNNPHDRPSSTPMTPGKVTVRFVEVPSIGNGVLETNLDDAPWVFQRIMDVHAKRVADALEWDYPVVERRELALDVKIDPVRFDDALSDGTVDLDALVDFDDSFGSDASDSSVASDRMVRFDEDNLENTRREAGILKGQLAEARASGTQSKIGKLIDRLLCIGK